MYIKHLAESAIFKIITSKNIFSYFERYCNKCQTFLNVTGHLENDTDKHERLDNHIDIYVSA
jgi:hypothetical protein